MGHRGILETTVRICPAQTACDGVTLLRGREICRACERAEKKRGREVKPRGTRYCEYEVTRGKLT
jgi:hypothetical protein